MSIPGSDAVGRLALGQIPRIDGGGLFFGWTIPLQKKGLSAALVATTISGYVPQPPQIAVPPPPFGGAFSTFSQPPPKVGVSVYVQPQPAFRMFPIAGTPGPLVFSTFVERYTKPPQQSEPWVSFELTSPFQATFTGFYPFSQPLVKTTFAHQEQPNPLFEVRLTPPPPFTSFTDFGIPLQTKYTFANEQWNINFEITPPPPFPAGGGSRKPIVEDRPPAPRHKRKTGFEPIKKNYDRPVVEEPKLPVPPTLKRIPRAPTPAPALIDPALIPANLLGIEQQIMSAQDTSDVLRFMESLEQDEQDIAEVLEMLDRLDEEDT